MRTCMHELVSFLTNKYFVLPWRNNLFYNNLQIEFCKCVLQIRERLVLLIAHFPVLRKRNGILKSHRGNKTTVSGLASTIRLLPFWGSKAPRQAYW